MWEYGTPPACKTYTQLPTCLPTDQGGRCCASVRAALTERSGTSTKGRTPNIRYFVAKLSIVAIYVLFERLSHGFNESHPAFAELSTKAILLS